MIDITVSLEWAKNLKDVGWEHKKAMFYWQEEDGKSRIVQVIEPIGFEFRQFYAAPTCEEILRELPQKIDESRLQINRLGKLHEYHWSVCYSNTCGSAWREEQFISDTLANVSASMWIFLKKNNLLNDD